MTDRPEKRLIVNADDMGFSPGVSEGILRAHREGIVTSTTLAANMPAAESAVAMLTETPTLGVGVHLNACQGPALSQAGRDLLAGDDGCMDRKGTALIRACAFRPRMLDAIASEFDAQIRWVLDHGVRPTHLDSHRHVHGWPGVFRRVVALARRYNIRFIRRLRPRMPSGDWPAAPRNQHRAATILGVLEVFCRRSARGFTAADATWGIAHTGLIDADWLVRAVALMPAGITEIMVHPGDRSDLSTAQTRLRESRLAELEALCDPRVQAAVQQQEIRLTHYGRL